MSPRRRNPENEDLPAFLYTTVRGGYEYTRPTDKKRFYMGRDRQKAIETALQLNIILLEEREQNRILDVLGRGRLVNDFLDKHYKELLKERQLAVTTIKDYDQKLWHVRMRLGKSVLAHVTVLQIAEFLDSYPPVQSNRYRALLSIIWRYSMAKGWVQHNVVLDTLAKRERVKRQRLTMDAFRAIHARAQPLIANAMDIGLITLQRRGDLVRLRWTDIKDGYLYVKQQKTSRPLRIKIDKLLGDILTRCKSDGVLSPWVLHHGYVKRNRTLLGTQVTPEYVSKGFQRARERAELYKELEPLAKPSFHEVRALGAEFYRKNHVSQKQIQDLLGHTNERTSKVYLSRHAPEVPWIEIDLQDYTAFLE